MKHTALPWIFDEKIDSPDCVIWDNDNQEPICTCWNRAGAEQVGNAELIVRACNSHDELVEALKTFMRLETDRRAGCQFEPLDYAECYQAGSEALANATK